MPRAAAPRGSTRISAPVRRIVSAVVAALVAGAVGASVARADEIATIDGCAAQSLSRPFLPFLDPALYTPVANQGFESGRRGWTLSGQAAVVAGNEAYHVAGYGDSHALALGDGGSAATTPICVDPLHPTARLFVRNAGAPASVLAVDAVLTDASGLLQTVPMGLLVAGPAWQPSLPLPIPSVAAALTEDGTLQVRLRFTALGAGADWRIDDVYVDPYKVT